MKLVWLNRMAAELGGCERSIEAAVTLLGERYGVESLLLYELGSPLSPSFTRRFAGAMPVVDLARQLRAIEPDAVFVHRAPEEWLATVAELRGPRRVAFVHDHDLFCLRRHKTTQLERLPCTRQSGWACLTRCVPVSRGSEGLELRSPSTLVRGQRALARFDAVVAPSAYMEAEVRRHGVPADRLFRQAPYLELPPPRDAHAAAADTLVYAGALTRGKGVGVLIDAFARLDGDSRLVLIGDGPQADEFRQRIEANGLAARVALRGRLPRDHALAEMRSAAAVVVPSLAPETFGLAGAEALAAEVPVVATACGGTTEWLEDGVTGLAVPPGDVGALASALRRVLADPDGARVRARRGRQRVLALCDRGAYGRQMSALLGLAPHAAQGAA